MEKAIQNLKSLSEKNKKRLILESTDINEIKIGVRKNNRAYTVRTHRDRIFNPVEWKKFFDTLKKSQELTFKLLLITGARINEVRHLRPQDVDYSNQRITLWKTKQRPNKNNIKKSKTRTIRVNKEMIRDLKREDNNNNLNSKGYFKILSTSAANIAMKKALIKSNIKDWYMFAVQSIRKTSENWALAIGVDSMKLSKRFGHSLITEYQNYAQSDAFTYKEKDEIKEIFGDLFIK